MSNVEEIRKQIAEVEKEPCRCVSCGLCGGSGHYWVDLNGHYAGQRADDCGDLETCDECRGSGIVENCDRCQLLNDMDCQLEEAGRAEERCPE